MITGMLRTDRLDGSHLLKAGSKWALEGVVAQVFRTGRSARMDGYSQALGEMTAMARRVGGRSRVGAPIIIDDRLWGAAVALNFASGGLPAAAVERIANFADLITTAMSNAETRSKLIASRARAVAAADDSSSAYGAAHCG